MLLKIPLTNLKFRIELWEIKAISKLFLRKLAYNYFIQKFIIFLIYSYLLIVYKTSSKKYIGLEEIYKKIGDKKPIIFAFWHNRLMMIPFFARKIKKKIKSHNFMTLASKHGDGKFVGMTMEKFGLISILGSTNDKKKPSRGIDYSSMRKIINGLKSGYSLGITPDGPRGPNQQINGELINIARLTNASVIALSYSSSNFKIVKKSWDKFKIPLPFSKLCFVVDKIYFEVDKSYSDDNEFLKHKKDITDRLNQMQKKADEFLNKNYN